jgi:hypothetical protein
VSPTAKVSGLGAQVIVADAGGTLRTISNDLTDFSFNTPRAIQDITGVDKSAHERLLLLADYSVQIKGVVNTAAGMSHAVFSTIPSTAVNRSVSIAPTANNSTPILVANCVLSDYGVARSANGDLAFSVKGDLADGALPTWS